MKPRHPALLIALLALPVVFSGDRLESNPVVSSPAHDAGRMPAFAAGQILNLDPSGKFSPVQHAADVQLILGDAVSTSSEGLVQEKSRVPGGGIRMNLQGRFQSAMTMKVDANGTVSAPCVPAANVPVKATGEVK